MNRRNLLKSLIALPLVPQVIKNNTVSASGKNIKFADKKINNVLIDGYKYELKHFTVTQMYNVHTEYSLELELGTFFNPQVGKIHQIELDYPLNKVCGTLVNYRQNADLNSTVTFNVVKEMKK